VSRAECQVARVSEIKNVSYTWMTKCNRLTSLPFKGLKLLEMVEFQHGKPLSVWKCAASYVTLRSFYTTTIGFCVTCLFSIVNLGMVDPQRKAWGRLLECNISQTGCFINDVIVNSDV